MRNRIRVMSKKKNLNSLICELETKHPNLDFSLIKNYVNNHTKVKVICHEKDCAGHEHGVFEAKPLNLLNGRGCPKCKGKGFTSDERKELCAVRHNGKYDYSKSDFSKVKNKTIVTCPIHGDFEIDFDHHFTSGVGCKFCSYPSRDTVSFIKEAKKIHNDFYSYDDTIYENAHKKVKIKCPIHGFFYQSPNAHLRGQRCPECANNNFKLEEEIFSLLKEEKIDFVRNHSPKWLKTEKGGQSSIDFFIPCLNLGIECQGKQHMGFGGWRKNYNFMERYEIDKWKKNQCEKNNINLIYYLRKEYAPNEYLGEFFTNANDLMKYIKYLLKNNF